MKGSRESHVCIGTHDALTGQGIFVRASGRDVRHPLRRPCDVFWNTWMGYPGRRFPMNSDTFRVYRIPFMQSGQLVIKFHGRGRSEDE